MSKLSRHNLSVFKNDSDCLYHGILIVNTPLQNQLTNSKEKKRMKMSFAALKL